MSQGSGIRFLRLAWVLVFLIHLVLGGISLSSETVIKELNLPGFSGLPVNNIRVGEYVPAEVIVRAFLHIKAEAVDSLALQLGGWIKACVPEHRLYLIQLSSPKADESSSKIQVKKAITKIRFQPEIEAAFPNYVFWSAVWRTPSREKLNIRRENSLIVKKAPQAQPFFQDLREEEKTAGSNPLAEYQWHLFRIKLFQAGEPPAKAPLIAVVCSGVDYTHPDLKDRVIKGWDFVEDDADPMDDFGAGTALAGLAAAPAGKNRKVLGVSPTSKILAVRILDRFGRSTYFKLVQGLTYALKFPGVKVITVGVRTWMDEDHVEFKTLKKLYDQALADGQLIVSPAGDNYNFNFYFYYGFGKMRPVPGWFPSSLTVAGTQETDCRTPFSNYDVKTLKKKKYNYNFVDLVAPGERLLSTWPGGCYETIYGTAGAAALVAGACARVWGRNPNRSPEQVVNHLQRTGRKLRAKAHGFYTKETRLDMMKAMRRKQTGFTGMVYNGQTGLPLPKVRVEAVRGSSVVASCFSSKSGFFTLTGLKGGISYSLRFTKKRYKTYLYSGLQAVANSIEDVFLPVFLYQERPAGQWSILICWSSLDPGWTDAWNARHNPLWEEYPVKWHETWGTYFLPYLMLEDEVIIDPENQVRGSLREYPYAALTHDALDTWVPSHCLVIKEVQNGTYMAYCMLDNDYWFSPLYDDLLMWGKYKGKFVEARASIYFGSTLKVIIPAKAASGSGPYWYIASIKGSSITIINRLQADPPSLSNPKLIK